MSWIAGQKNDSPDIHISGCAVVDYVLANADGSVISAEILRDQAAYMRLEEVDKWLEKH